VNVSGAALPGGSHLQCRLTPNSGPSNAGDALTVPASRSSAADGALLCDTPSQVASVAALRVAPNAQQFSAPYTYAYYPPPVVSASSPASGPSDGGTVVVVHGSHLAPSATLPAQPTCDVVCRFGELLVTGVVYHGSRTIVCQSPPNALADGTAVPLTVSLNRQQYSNGEHSFRYTSARALTAVVPRTSPISGGTLLTVRAHDLSGGDDYTCKFVRESDAAATVVNATLDGGHVLCTSPPVDAVSSALGDAYNFTISPNRQQYRTPLPFTYYDAPLLATASPASGPTDGGALVSISGSFLAGGDNYT
jgi:hypothetical protein